MPHQPAPSYHGRNNPPSQSYYSSRGGESVRTYPPSQPLRGHRSVQPYKSNSNHSKDENNNGRDYYQDYASEPPHYNHSQGSYHVPSAPYRRPLPNTYPQNRAHLQYRTHGRHQPDYREYETTEQTQPPQVGGGQRFYNQNINSGRVHRSDLNNAAPIVVSSSFSHQSMTEQQVHPSDEKEEDGKMSALASTSHDDTHESAEEVAVSALLLSAGGPPRSCSLSRTPSTSESAKTMAPNSYVQQQSLAQNVAVKLEQNNTVKPSKSQEVGYGQISATPQTPRIKIEETPKSEGLPSEVNFSHFPSILHKVLTSSEYSGKVLEWLPHGQAWRVLRWDELAKIVLPSFFPNMCLDDDGDCSERMNCFLWHVRSWGFQEVKDVGPDMGAYWHNCFIQDDAKMCHQMHPYPPGGFSSKGNKKDQESPKVNQPLNTMSNAAVVTSKIPRTLSSNSHHVQRAPINNGAMTKNESESQSLRISNEENHVFSRPPHNNLQNSIPGKQLTTAPQVPNFSYKDSRYAVRLDRKRCISQDETSIVSTSPVKRRPLYRHDEDPQNAHRFNPPNKYYSSEVVHLSRTPSWPKSNKGISPSRQEHYAKTRFNHYHASYASTHHGGLVPESPPYEVPNQMYREAETRLQETHHLSMPYSVTDRNLPHHSPNQVSPDRAPRETGQRLRSGRGGARAHAPQAIARLDRRNESEQRTEKSPTPSNPAPNFSVSTRGKGNIVSQCVRKNSSSSHMSEPIYNPNHSMSELGIYGPKSRSLEQSESSSSLPSMPVGIAVSRKTKRQRMGNPP